MDLFSYRRIATEIGHRLVELDFADDIARLSFLAQHSISPLDLALQDSLNFVNVEFFFGFSNISVLDPRVQHPKYLINTEEKCRKMLSVTRNILYRLNLDLPKKREYSLKDGPKPEDMQEHCFSPHIGKLCVHPNFYFAVLSKLVKEAVKRTDKKLKMIKWLVTFVKEDACLNLPDVDYFTECIFPEVTDSAFVTAFLKKFHFGSWMVRNERSDFLEFFLFHLRQNDSTVKDNTISFHDPLDESINGLNFLNIGVILKYQDAPRVPHPGNVWGSYLLPFESEYPSIDVICEAEDWMSPTRFYLMLQLLYIYFNRRTPSAENCLRFLWNSLPDAFFSYKEIEKALSTGLSSETLRDVFIFYSRAVGVFHCYAEPRSLKQLCRPAVRRMLWESGCWIPDGIKLTGVPRELQSFLNLED